MTKTDLVAKIAEKAGITKAAAEKALEATFDAIATLPSDDKLTVIGFGTFSWKKTAERMGTNPAKKEPMKIAAKTVLKFKPSPKIEKRP